MRTLRDHSQRLLILALAISPLNAALAHGGAAGSAAPPASAPDAAAAPSPPEAEPLARLEVPLFSDLFDELPVAQVGDEVITLAALRDGLATMHQDRRGTTGTRKLDLGPPLDRLVNVKLIVLEAREMGIDGLDEVKKALESFKAMTLRDTIKAEVTKGVGPDTEAVEKAYAEAAREWKLRSVLFTTEEDASAMVSALAAGKSFEELAAQAVADKKAKGAEEGTYASARKMHHLVLAQVAKLEPGGTSGAIKLPDGVAVVRLEDVRTGNDPQIRGMLEQTSRDHKIREALQANYQALAKKYARIDKALLKSLDFHAKKPGLTALFKDKRVLATVTGGKPVTVADLTSELNRKFYHGAARAVREKKINPQKQDTFESLLYRRLLEVEAERRKIAETEAFKRRVTEKEDELLFGHFVQRVIMPTVDVKESEGQARYEEEKSSYMYPQFYKLESLAFSAAPDAEAAVAKLKAGTDLKWLRAHAENQVKDPRLQFDGSTTVAASTLDDDLEKALAGAKVGDHRLHAAADGTAYVLRVVEETGASPRPYTDVREEVLTKIFGEKVTKAVEEWAGKLRAAHEVKVFIKDIGE